MKNWFNNVLLRGGISNELDTKDSSERTKSTAKPSSTSTSAEDLLMDWPTRDLQQQPSGSGSGMGAIMGMGQTIRVPLKIDVSEKKNTPSRSRGDRYMHGVPPMISVDDSSRCSTSAADQQQLQLVQMQQIHQVPTKNGHGSSSKSTTSGGIASRRSKPRSMSEPDMLLDVDIPEESPTKEQRSSRTRGRMKISTFRRRSRSRSTDIIEVGIQPLGGEENGNNNGERRRGIRMPRRGSNTSDFDLSVGESVDQSEGGLSSAATSAADTSAESYSIACKSLPDILDLDKLWQEEQKREQQKKKNQKQKQKKSLKQKLKMGSQRSRSTDALNRMSAGGMGRRNSIKSRDVDSIKACDVNVSVNANSSAATAAAAASLGASAAATAAATSGGRHSSPTSVEAVPEAGTSGRSVQRRTQQGELKSSTSSSSATTAQITNHNRRRTALSDDDMRMGGSNANNNMIMVPTKLGGEGRSGEQQKILLSGNATTSSNGSHKLPPRTAGFSNEKFQALLHSSSSGSDEKNLQTNPFDSLRPSSMADDKTVAGAKSLPDMLDFDNETQQPIKRKPGSSSRSKTSTRYSSGRSVASEAVHRSTTATSRSSKSRQLSQKNSADSLGLKSSKSHINANNTSGNSNIREEREKRMKDDEAMARSLPDTLDLDEILQSTDRKSSKKSSAANRSSSRSVASAGMDLDEILQSTDRKSSKKSAAANRSSSRSVASTGMDLDDILKSTDRKSGNKSAVAASRSSSRSVASAGMDLDDILKSTDRKSGNKSAVASRSSSRSVASEGVLRSAARSSIKPRQMQKIQANENPFDILNTTGGDATSSAKPLSDKLDMDEVTPMKSKSTKSNVANRGSSRPIGSDSSSTSSRRNFDNSDRTLQQSNLGTNLMQLNDVSCGGNKKDDDKNFSSSKSLPDVIDLDELQPHPMLKSSSTRRRSSRSSSQRIVEVDIPPCVELGSDKKKGMKNSTSMPDMLDLLDEPPQPKKEPQPQKKPAMTALQKKKMQAAYAAKSRSRSHKIPSYDVIRSDREEVERMRRNSGNSENMNDQPQEQAAAATSSSRRNSGTSQMREQKEAQKQRKKRYSRTLPGEGHIASKVQQDELLMEWPTEQNGPVRYPSTILSEHAPPDRINKDNSRKEKKGMSACRSINSLPDILDLDELIEQQQQQEQQLPQVIERPQRRFSSASTMLITDMKKPNSTFYRPKGKGDADKGGASRRTRSKSTDGLLDIDGISNRVRPQVTSSMKKKNKKKMSVKFAEGENFRDDHTYHYPSDIKVSNLFYSRDDDTTFSDATVTHARAIRSYIKTSITQDGTFNSLTGLPSPDVLSRHLLSPEDIIGVEHLLCGRGIARASLALKMNHTKMLLDEQRKGADPVEMGNKLSKYSDISSKLAVCRASYAAMF